MRMKDQLVDEGGLVGSEICMVGKDVGMRKRLAGCVVMRFIGVVSHCELLATLVVLFHQSLHSSEGLTM